VKKLRILHVCHSLRFGGGIETWVVNLFRYHDRERMQMDYCYTDSNPGEMADELKKYGANIISCRMGFNYLFFPHRFAKILTEGSYDAVHIHGNDFSGPAIHGAKIANVPVRIANYYSTSTGHRNDFKRLLYLWPMRRWIEREATNILACSSAILKCRWPVLYKQGDQRLSPMYIGVDLGEFRQPIDKNAVRKSLGIPLNVPVIGHVGRFWPVKNHAGFLRIAAKVSERMPDAHFLFVGDGPLKSEIEKMAKDFGLADRTIFAGVRNDIPVVLAAMDVFLFPSLWEGFGNVVTEAIVSGLPVVVSDVVPAASEIGIGPFKEFAFPLDNEEVAVANVLWLLEHRGDAAKMVEQCSEELDQFEILDNLKRLEKIYGNR